MTRKGWAFLTKEQVLDYFEVDFSRGLVPREAGSRLEEEGPNLLQEDRGRSILGAFLDQFKDFMVLILLGATFVSGLLGEYTDAITIIIIVVVNALLGFFQEFRAEKSLAALKQLTAPSARVIRGGEEVLISAAEVVAGDVALLDAGDRVPADMRILSSANLNINESSMTGESLPVEKREGVLKEFHGNLGDYTNMAFMGTLVTSGRGKGVVVATGMDTEMGKIAHLLQEAGNEDTPLQKRLAQLGKYLVGGCLAICFLVALLGVYRGEDPYKMLMAGVSLAVAAIPEGLPAIVTIALAIGVQRMIRRNAIVRKLPAVETLGCATIICSDKTGTLTQNRMTVQEVLTARGAFTLSGNGNETHGIFSHQGKDIKPAHFPDLIKALKAAVYCNNAFLQKKGVRLKAMWREAGRPEDLEIKGDPTEGALLVAAVKAGVWREDLEKEWTREQEYPFDSTRKRMGVIYGKEGEKRQAFYKGAPDIIIEQCSFYQDGEGVRPLTDVKRNYFYENIDRMASQALRNIAVACKEMPAGPLPEKEPDQGLVFLGVFGMQDPPRPEVAQEILKSRRAGIRTVMITGDHKITALAVARKLGLMADKGKVLTGREMDSLDEDGLSALVEDVAVYARVAPQHKLRIVKALKKKGHVVAMTGDGVNDAPAVKEADIGIAMGKTGTDVTKEAADLILSDDNYGTIVAAVEEGRNIYENIKKFIHFLLSCNIGEIMTMFIAMLAGLPLPLRAIQILWVNLATDGLPAMALGVDPADEGIMRRPPRPTRESIFAGGLWQRISIQGINIGIVTVIAFAYMLQKSEPLILARTVAFATLILAQLVYVFDCRVTGHRRPPFFSNPYLLASVMSSLFLLAVVVYQPFLQQIFHTTPLPLEVWAQVVGFAVVPTLLSRILAKKPARQMGQKEPSPLSRPK
jgi:P-type Ca2+ transporter type 2C